MRVIGTAGHVDHGKSTLVEALTGINPDRLQEEQDRQMTIDLGFAWLELPGGEEIGIIDVPGHRDFIENMLAGVGGIDAALFVIAADEGVMPQSREHLAILDLLDITNGVIAITKVDLVSDPDWLKLVQEDVRELVKNTSLASAPIVLVSGISGEGLEELQSELAKVLQGSPQRTDTGKPRLPVDRVFSIAGFGTIVTGTLSDGVLMVGEQVDVLPSGASGRIRGLQTHKVKLDKAVPGSRAAVNLSGIEVDQIQRGDVLAYPGSYRPTKLIDVAFRLVPDADSSLRHNQAVKLFLGAAQRMARVRLLGVDELTPGEEGWLQLVLEEPTVTSRGDHYIIRRPSPGATLGGGLVADAHPARRHRRKDPDVLERLQQILRGSPAEVLAQELKRQGPQSIAALVKSAGIDAAQAQEAVDELVRSEQIVALSDGSMKSDSETLIADRGWISGFDNRVQSILGDYHNHWPLRLGMPKEELKSRLKLGSREYSGLLQWMSDESSLTDEGVVVRLDQHAPALNAEMEERSQRWLKRFHAQPYGPPSVKESRAELESELYQYLLDSKMLTQVSAEVVFLTDTYQEMVSVIREIITEQGGVTVAEVRDRFQTSRKFILALMEHLDEIGLTVRQGDVRSLAPGK
jgi:selenocysteine-specific elongation factor